MTTLNYPIGIDCVWIASDSVGDLGAFVTAGSGPIPLRALNNDWLPIADIEEAICKLPSISTGKILVQIKRPDDFLTMAERGFFVYDWQDIHRSKILHTNAYEKVAEPQTPVKKGVLPEKLSLVASSVFLSKLKFSEMSSIDLLDYVECAMNRP